MTDSQQLGDLMVGPAEMMPSRDLDDREYGYALRAAVVRLEPSEQVVIMCRFGFVDNEEWTSRRISVVIGLSHGRVRQIEREALGKLRILLKTGYLCPVFRKRNQGNILTGEIP